MSHLYSRRLGVLNCNDASGVFKEISNSYQSALAGALIEVAYCQGKVEILNIIDNNFSKDINYFIEDESIYEEVKILNQGIQRGEKNFSFEYTTKNDKRLVLVRAVYTEKLYQSQFPIFRLYIYDVTELKNSIEKEQQNSLEIQHFTDSLPAAILKLELKEGFPITWCNGNLLRDTGYNSWEINHIYNGNFLEVIEEKDRVSFCAIVNKSVSEDRIITGNLSVKTKDGLSLLYKVQIMPISKTPNSSEVVYCILSAMTENMRKEQELKNFEERYKMILSFASEVMFEYDRETDVMRYFGGEQSTVKRPCYISNFYKKAMSNSLPGGRLTEESRDEIKRIFTQFTEDKLESIDGYLCYEIGNKKTNWIYLVAQCIFSEDNEAMVLVGKISDVTVHKEIEHKLMIKANTDYLTRVSNREYSQDVIEKYLAKYEKDKLLALFIIDIDNFKNINDFYGHLEGDNVLMKIGDILRDLSDEKDLIGRLGGDEFIVFIKDVPTVYSIYEKAEAICKQVRESIDHVTVSVGVSAFENIKTFQDLYKTADIALYQAKLRGKDTFVCYNDLSDNMKKLADRTSSEIDVTDLMELTSKEDFNSIVCDSFSKTILESYDYIYVVNLTKDKVRRFNEEDYIGSEHNFRTYTEMFEHIHKEIFDTEEQMDYVQYFGRVNLIETFTNEERLVHRYIRVFNHNQEFHWYFIEAVLNEVNPQGDVICVIMFKDVQKSRSDEMRKYEDKTKTHMIQKLEDEKSFDSLTGLYQANKFYDVAREKIWSDTSKNYAIISFDIDNFRVINDVYSEEVGDQIICYIADVLRGLTLEDKVYCRYYADCFTILICYDTRQDIVDVINCIREECCKASYTNASFKISFGVYLVTDLSIPIRLMCDWARLACRPIKGLTNQYYAFYNEEYRKELVETQRIEAEMYNALLNEEFKMYLQPKYNLRTNQVVGAEALVRWHHPKQGILYPNRFIKLFEKNGFILQLDEYMWEQACKELRKLLDMGVECPISVNISRLHIYDPSLVQKLLNLVNKYQIPVNLLELEFTESLFMENVRMLYGLMYDLKKNGFVLHMDDFGSGFSSLNMLKSVPIDVIKLDKAFFEDISENSRGRIIIEDSIKMIHNLKLEVMAEGIETREHVDFLNRCNCVIGQGYYYAKPMPLKDFDDMIIETDESKSEV